MAYRVEGDEIVFATAKSLHEALKMAKKVAQNKQATFLATIGKKEIVFTSDEASSFYITLGRDLDDPKRVKKEVKKVFGKLVSQVNLRRKAV